MLCSRAAELDRSRCELLYDLGRTVDEEEATTETLLKAFDIDLYPSPALSTPFKLQNPANEAELSKDLPTESRLSTSLNPFLTTPLRLKHFPRLSPSILVGLLRSPSLRGASLDDSLESIPRSTPEFNDFYLDGFPNHPTNSCTDGGTTLEFPQYSPPLTPPPSARIPFSTRLSDPDLDAGGTMHLYSDSQAVSFPLASHRAAPTTQPNSLVSASTVRNFQRVIDEMRGVDFGNEPPVKLEAFAPASSSGPPSADLPSAHLPSVVQRTLGVLEEEFIELLHQRAAEAEQDVLELRALADRLEKVGKGRRELAAVMEETLNAQRRA